MHPEHMLSEFIPISVRYVFLVKVIIPFPDGDSDHTILKINKPATFQKQPASQVIEIMDILIYK